MLISISARARVPGTLVHSLYSISQVSSIVSEYIISRTTLVPRNVEHTMGCAGLDGLDYTTYPWILKNSKPVLQVGLLEFPSMT